jgi:hypothetical protein
VLDEGNSSVSIGPRAAAAIRLLLFTGVPSAGKFCTSIEYVDFERGLLFLPESQTPWPSY